VEEAYSNFKDTSNQRRSGSGSCLQQWPLPLTSSSSFTTGLGMDSDNE